MWVWINTYKYTILTGMNIQLNQLFWCSPGVLLVLTHCHVWSPGSAHGPGRALIDSFCEKNENVRRWRPWSHSLAGICTGISRGNMSWGYFSKPRLSSYIKLFRFCRTQGLQVRSEILAVKILAISPDLPIMWVNLNHHLIFYVKICFRNIETNTVWWFGTFFIFPYIGNNTPNWLIFFSGVETTNQNNLNRLNLEKIHSPKAYHLPLKHRLCEAFEISAKGCWRDDWWYAPKVCGELP